MLVYAHTHTETGKRTFPIVKKLFEDAKIEVTDHESKAPCDITKATQEMSFDGYDGLVAIGGDGCVLYVCVCVILLLVCVFCACFFMRVVCIWVCIYSGVCHVWLC